MYTHYMKRNNEYFKERNKKLKRLMMN